MSSSAARALARRVTDAHGGLDAWHEAAAHRVRFSTGGLAFASKGQRRTLSGLDGSFATGSQRITLHGSSPRPWTSHVDSATDLKVKVGRLRQGRRGFRWSIEDIAAFGAAAMCTYLSLPFVLSEPDVQLEVLAGSGSHDAVRPRHDDDFSGATEAAERAVVEPMIAAICDYARVRGWPESSGRGSADPSTDAGGVDEGL